MKTPPLLFGEEELPWRPADDPGEAQARLETMLVKMRAAASWPWEFEMVAYYRKDLWPSLFARLSQAEAARLRSEMNAETARLDAA